MIEEGKEEDKPPIVLENPIDGIRFTLIEKTVLSNEYVVVRIQSLNLTTLEIADFWVYRSNSELGFWRLCSSVEGNPTRLYKGDPDILNSNYDYIQSTLIHIRLQYYINLHFNDINEIKDIITSGIENIKKNKEIIQNNNTNVVAHNLLSYFDENTNKWFVLSNPLSDEYKAIVDDPKRSIKEEPFITTYDRSVCGEEVNPEILTSFSKTFEDTFNAESPIKIIENYKYNFENIIDVTGNIWCINLNRISVPVPVEVPLSRKRKQNNTFTVFKTNNIQLYYLDASLCQLQSNEFLQNIKKICKLNKHIMPFLLIPTDSIVNILGLYSLYILVGAYICKLFDYAVQCSPLENKIVQCTINYTHIGNRYINLFPWKKNKRARGMTKKSNRSKRTTRKQQKREKERNKRKDRRSK